MPNVPAASNTSAIPTMAARLNLCSRATAPTLELLPLSRVAAIAGLDDCAGTCAELAVAPRAATPALAATASAALELDPLGAGCAGVWVGVDAAVFCCALLGD